MKAGWLSKVMIWGRLSTSKRRHSCSARTSTLTLWLLAESTNPPYPKSPLMRPTPKLLKAWPATVAAEARETSLPLLPNGWLLNAYPGVFEAP